MWRGGQFELHRTADTGEEPIRNRGCSSCLSLLIPACCSRHELNSMVSLILWIFMAPHWGTLPVLFQFPRPQPLCCSSFEWLSQEIRNTSEEPQSNPESLSCLADWYQSYPSISVLLPLCFKCVMKNKSWVNWCCEVYFGAVPYSWCAGTSLAGNCCPAEYSSIKPRHRLLFQYSRLWLVDHQSVRSWYGVHRKKSDNIRYCMVLLDHWHFWGQAVIH